jgi:hypothetical protein
MIEAARMRGTVLWFNTSKDFGSARTDEGVQIGVPGRAFAPGEKPVGRCAGREVVFESSDGVASAISFVPESSPRRARRRTSHR